MWWLYDCLHYLFFWLERNFFWLGLSRNLILCLQFTMSENWKSFHRIVTGTIHFGSHFFSNAEIFSMKVRTGWYNCTICCSLLLWYDTGRVGSVSVKSILGGNLLPGQLAITTHKSEWGLPKDISLTPR